MRLLLDTCAFIYIATGGIMRPEAVEALATALDADDVAVSPVTAWELGKLVSRGRLRLTGEPFQFFNGLIARPGFNLCELTPEILMKSSFLPDSAHKDPMDQILIATARALGLTLVTDDRAILAYGAEGHVNTLAC